MKLMSKVLQRKDPIRKSLRFAVNDYVRHDRLSVEYDVDIKHLINVSAQDIFSAIRRAMRAWIFWTTSIV